MSKVSKTTKECFKCGIDIFFAEHNDKWYPFNAEVATIARKGVLYVDGYDEVKRTENNSSVKGYPCHFDYCNG